MWPELETPSEVHRELITDWSCLLRFKIQDSKKDSGWSLTGQWSDAIEFVIFSYELISALNTVWKEKDAEHGENTTLQTKEGKNVVQISIFPHWTGAILKLPSLDCWTHSGQRRAGCSSHWLQLTVLHFQLIWYLLPGLSLGLVCALKKTHISLL